MEKMPQKCIFLVMKKLKTVKQKVLRNHLRKKKILFRLKHKKKTENGKSGHVNECALL